jgi:hypothetical protein
LSLWSIWSFQADQLNLKFSNRPSLYVVFKTTKWVYGQFDFFLTDQVYLKFSSLVYYTQSCLYHVNIILSHIILYLNMK